MRYLFVTIIMGALLLNAGSLSRSSQAVVVTTKNWSINHGTLRRYEKQAGAWKQVGNSIAVKVGKNGLGWGRGLHRVPKDAKHIKREGDGRAPAGIFALSYAFGDKKFDIRYPYRQMTHRHHCVDDSRSRYYNQVVNSKKIKKDYRSFEHMKFASGLYSYGLFVDHNPKHIANAGSCIFLHIKKPSGRPTVGCTAMSKLEIKHLIKWLDPQKRPLLVQAPEEMMGRLFP